MSRDQHRTDLQPATPSAALAAFAEQLGIEPDVFRLRSKMIRLDPRGLCRDLA